MQLEEQSSEPRKKVKVNLARSGHYKPLAPLDPAVNTELELLAPSLIQPLGVVLLIPSPLSSTVPVILPILPQVPSGPSYAIYLQPTQAQMLTPPHGLRPTVFSTQCSNATGSKGPTDTPLEKTTTDATKSNASCRPGSLQSAPERQGTKNRSKEMTGEPGTKRMITIEDSSSSSLKKAKEDLKALENVPAPTTLFPSGYLILLTQCSSLGPDCVVDPENSGTLSSNHRIYGSPFAGVITVASSELTAVNFHPFHVTPLKLTVSLTSMTAVPVGNSQALNSSHSAPTQNPSSVIVNSTLQHLGLISTSMQMSASPGPGVGTVPLSPRVEATSVIPDNLSSRQGRATNHDSPVLGQSQLSGHSSLFL